MGFKWHFSVKMALWSTPRVPFKGTRGVFWGARAVIGKHKRTVLKLRGRTWAFRVPRIHLHAASHAAVVGSHSKSVIVKDNWSGGE